MTIKKKPIMEEKVRYSDEDLAEFKQVILDKLSTAKTAYEMYSGILRQTDGNHTDDTSPTYKGFEDGANELSKEEAGVLADRQRKFITNLENALIRIENKTYGVDTVTGKLIPKERLMAVPHATKSIETKNAEKK